MTRIEPVVRRNVSRRRGNFAFRTVVSTFEPRAEDLMPDHGYFGLGLLGCYFYSGFRDAEGNIYAPMRKFVSEMSSGLSLQSNAGRDYVGVDFEALARSQRGVGVRWTLEGNEVAIQASRTPFSQPIDVRIGGDRLSWNEGDLLDLRGRLLAPGFQWYMPMRDEAGGNFYASQIYRAGGVVAGRKVEGFVGLDCLYGPPGQVYQTGPLFNGVEMAWSYFANTYADGSFECGHLAFGAGHWGFAMIVDREGEVAMASDVACDIELRLPSRYVERATYHVPGGDWAFTAAERGEMRDLAAQRQDKYHGQAGVVRRAGDRREPELSMAWMESFPMNGTVRA